MWVLCCKNRIEHYRKISTRRILHSCRKIKSARRHTMLLIFDRPCTYRNIRKYICDISPVIRIEHLICSSKSGYFHYMNLHMSHCDKTRLKIRLAFRIRLSCDSLISFACSPRLIRINPRDQDQSVLNLLIDLSKPFSIIAYRILIIRRARSNYQEKSVVLPCNNIFYGSIPFTFYFPEFVRDRKFCRDLFGCRKLLYKFK